METKNRKLQRPKVVMERTGLGRTSLWSKSRNSNDSFPSPVQIGVNSIAFYADEIDLWLETRPRVKCHDGTIKAARQEVVDDRETAAA